MKSHSLQKHNGWKYLLAVLIVVVHILPIYVLLTMAFKTPTDFGSRLAMPGYLYLENFLEVMRSGKIFDAIKNTIIVAAFTLLTEVILGCMASYPLARNQSRFNEKIRYLIMGVMMVPPLSILVGVYSMIVDLNGISTYWGIILVEAAFGLPRAIFLFTNFVAAIPTELDEAAAIDGAGIFQTFFKVILPQVKPVTVTVILLGIVNAWNDYVYPSYILQKPAMYTVVLLVKRYFSDTATDLHGAAAVCVLGMLPVIVLYVFLQKYFVQGTLDSAVKG